MASPALNIEESIKKYGGVASAPSSSIEDSLAKYGAKPAAEKEEGFLSKVWDVAKKSFSTSAPQALSNVFGDGRKVPTVEEHYENLKKALERPTAEARDFITKIPGGRHLLSLADASGHLVAGTADAIMTPAGLAATVLSSPGAAPLVRNATLAAVGASQVPTAIEKSKKFAANPSAETFGPAVGATVGAAAPILHVGGEVAPKVAAVAKQAPVVIKDAAVGAYKGATAPTTLPIKVRGVPLAEVEGVPASVTGAALGYGAGHVVPVYGPPIGAVIGGMTPAVKGAIARIKEGLAERTKPAPVAATPEVIPINRQLSQGAIIPEAPADTSGPIPTDPATGYPLKPGQAATEPVAPVTPEVIPPAIDPQVKLLDDIAIGQVGKPFEKLSPEAQTTVRRVAAGIERANAAKAKPVPQPTQAPVTQPPEPAPQIAETPQAEPATIQPASATEATKDAATITKTLIDGGITPEEIGRMDLHQWALAGEALGLDLKLTDIVKARDAALKPAPQATTAEPVKIEAPAAPLPEGVEPAGVTIRRENAPDSIPAPAGAPVFEQPRIMTEDGVKAYAQENGVPLADARKQLLDDGFSIMGRGTLNRALHAIGAELGLDHEALSGVVRMPYKDKGYKSMAQMSQDEMLAELNALQEKRAITTPLASKKDAPKPGDVVELRNGQRVTVKKINNDGSFEHD